MSNENNRWTKFVGAGWRPIVAKAVKDLEGLKWRTEGFDYTILQVKEKFGTLRIYFVTTGPPEFSSKVQQIVDSAEDESMRTCEICGNSGKLRNLNWVKTLCDEHFNIRQRDNHMEHR